MTKGPMISRLIVLLPAACLLCATNVANGQEAPAGQRQATASVQEGSSNPRPTLVAVRASAPPVVNGKLDDPIWRTAARVEKLVQERPVEGAPATEPTEIWMAYDSERLYFAVYAHYSNPSLIRANRADRDKTEDDDTVTIFLEPFLDYLKGYSFSVNGYAPRRRIN